MRIARLWPLLMVLLAVPAAVGVAPSPRPAAAASVVPVASSADS
jgi:hypothetical protein